MKPQGKSSSIRDQKSGANRFQRKTSQKTVPFTGETLVVPHREKGDHKP